EHVAVAVDDGQQVVEVVGNAAGEASDGLHFLRLQQLFLQAAALRGIAQDSVYGHRLAVLAHDAEVDLNDQQPAALDLDLAFQRPGRLARHQTPRLIPGRLPLSGGEQVPDVPFQQFL